MDFFKRCNGSTLCSYGKRIEKGVGSVLFYYGLLPQSYTSILFGRNLSTTSHVRPILRKALIRNYYGPAQPDQSSYHSKDASSSKYKLPNLVQIQLKSLKTDILTILLDQSAISSSFSNVQTKFSRSMQEMAKYYFDQGGKMIRPTVSLLMSQACNQMAQSARLLDNDQITLNQYRIAMVSEMIHTASLVHDDIIDESDIRRGQPTVNARWGNRQAVLVGDFILARATRVLCSIGNSEVVSTMAEIVEDLVQGELMQLTVPNDLEAITRFEHYLLRTFYKTASLFANSCKSVAKLAECNDEVQKNAFEFGKNLGLAFQLIDDLLDYMSTTSVLGKPTANDLRQGLATCPVLFAAQEYPDLNTMISRRFSKEGDVENAWKIVQNSEGLNKTRKLAETHSQKAIDLAKKFPNSDNIKCLVEIVLSQLNRKN